MSFRIEQADSGRESSGIYRYRIYRDNRIIASYWHDHKGDDHGIDFLNGKIESLPGRVDDFIQGGGPRPICLTEQAITYLREKADDPTPPTEEKHDTSSS